LALSTTSSRIFQCTQEQATLEEHGMDGIYAWHPILVGGLVVQSDNAEESIGKTMVEYEVAAKAAGLDF
jgi:hypothetical protein